MVQFIWARRWSDARGWHYTRERECDSISADAWLRVFRKDEPGVPFYAGAKPPRFH